MSRLIFSTIERGKINIHHLATISDIHFIYNCIGVICPCTCMCKKNVSDELYKSTYIQVLENRIEYNYPYSKCNLCMNCEIVDKVETIYFDRTPIQDTSIIRCCNYSHVLLSSSERCVYCSLQNHSIHNSCCGTVCLPFVENAEEFVYIVNDIRNKRLKKQDIKIMTIER